MPAPSSNLTPLLLALLLSTAAVGQETSFSVEVSVTGLQESTVTLDGYTVRDYEGELLRVQLNQGEEIEISQDGLFSFETQLADGADYSVTTSNQPFLATQVCEISNGSGQIDGSDVQIEVSCSTAPKFTIGGTVTGLEGTSLTLKNNAGKTLSISDDGEFTFDTQYLNEEGYAVHLQGQPFQRSCQIENWSGSIPGNDVDNILVECGPEQTANVFCVDTAQDLQTALSIAAVNGDDTEIRVVEGTYKGSFLYDTGTDRSITIEGGYLPGCNDNSDTPENTILDGFNKVRVAKFNSSGDITLTKLTIRNGFHKRIDDFFGVGGGLRAVTFDAGKLKLISNIVENNTANTDGGGAYLSANTPAALLFVNNIFRKNSACPLCPIKIESNEDTLSNFSGSGGALWMTLSNQAYLNMVNNTLFGNQASFGGGVRISMSAEENNESFARLINNIFDQNVSLNNEGTDVWMQYDVGADFVPENPPMLVNNNLDAREPEGVFADFDVDFNFSEDPRFVGPDEGNLELSADSPLIDAGLSSAKTETSSENVLLANSRENLPDDVTLPLTDIRGQPRVTGQSVDLGAYELPLLIFSDSFEPDQ